MNGPTYWTCPACHTLYPSNFDRCKGCGVYRFSALAQKVKEINESGQEAVIENGVLTSREKINGHAK